MKKTIVICLLAILVFACQHQIDKKSNPPSNLVYTPAFSTITKGTTGSSVTPSIDNGGGTIVFAIISSAVDGISIDQNTGIINWANTVSIGSYDIFVSASNDAGVVAATYKLIVSNAIVAPSGFSYSPSNSTVTKGTAGSSGIPSINNGGSNITFSLTGNILAGISINASTGEISWTNALTAGVYSITANAASSAGNATASFTLTVNNPATIAAPSGFAYTPSAASVVKGTAGISVIPSVITGGATIAYSLTGTLPAGISINSATGEISWSNAVAIGIYALTAKATNSAGSISTGYTLTVTAIASVTAPSSLLYSPSSSTITAGTAGSSATPTINSGLGTITYSLTGTIPAGITINASTGVISWSTVLTTGVYTITVKATNSAGSSTASYALTVNAATTTVSFSKDLLPTLTNSCGGCHSYTKTYAGVLSHTTGCTSIQDKIGTTYCSGSRMPQGSTPLSAAYIAQFNAWIAQGKLNN